MTVDAKSLLDILLDGNDLSADQAGELLRCLTAEDCPPAMGGALLAALRAKGETPEEKRARKAAVKQGRRDARAAKKGLKTTFKREEREMGKKQMVGDVRPGLSVTQLG